MAGLNFTTAKSRRRIALILNRLALGNAETPELITLVACNRCTLGLYLRHLSDLGSIECVRPMRFCHGSGTPAEWALSYGTVVPPLFEGDKVSVETFVKGDTRTVNVVRKWQPPKIAKQSIFAALGL